MARGIDVEISAHGFDHAANDLEQVGRRLLDAHHGFAKLLPILEEGERRHFDRAKGKYVRTGRLKASLTQPTANDAIRQAHAGGLTFGTATWYAHFLTRSRKDPEDGQVRARRRAGKSAVLVLTPKTRREASQTLLDWVTEPFGDDAESGDGLAVHRA